MPNNVNSITDFDDLVPSSNESVLVFLDETEIAALLEKEATSEKKAMDIIKYDIETIFTGGSIFLDEIKGHAYPGFSKSSYYRLKNDETIDWNKISIESALPIIREALKNSDLSHEVIELIENGALIIDDTTLKRPRSKKSELQARCFDHSDGSGYNGYRLLVFCWTNGVVTIPICFIIMSTSNSEMLQVPAKPVDENTPGGEYREMAQMKMTDVVIKMLHKLVEAGIPFSHVSADAWFTNKSFVQEVKKLGKNYTGRLKNHPNHKYQYKGAMKTVDEIVQASGGVPPKKEGQSGPFRKVPVTLVQKKKVKKGVRGKKGSAKYEVRTIKAYLIFCYNDNSDDPEEYIVFLSTLEADMEEAVYIYSLRWMIEVFFWYAKEHLGLKGKTKLIGYDALMSHVFIVCMRFRFLVYENSRDPNNYTLIEKLYELSKEAAGSYWHGIYKDFLNCFVENLRKLGVPQEIIDQARQMTIEEGFQSYNSSYNDNWKREKQIE